LKARRASAAESGRNQKRREEETGESHEAGVFPPITCHVFSGDIKIKKDRIDPCSPFSAAAIFLPWILIP